MKKVIFLLCLFAVNSFAQYESYKRINVSAIAARTSAGLNSVISDVGSESVELFLDGGQYAITADVTFNANTMVTIPYGSSLNISAGKTVTINGILCAGPYEIATGSGTVSGSPKFMYRHQEWGSNVSVGTGLSEPFVHNSTTNISESLRRLYDGTDLRLSWDDGTLRTNGITVLDWVNTTIEGDWENNGNLTVNEDLTMAGTSLESIDFRTALISYITSRGTNLRIRNTNETGSVEVYWKNNSDGALLSLAKSQARLQAPTNDGAFAVISSGHTNNLIYFTVQNNEPITVEDNNANGRTTLNLRTNDIDNVSDITFAGTGFEDIDFRTLSQAKITARGTDLRIGNTNEAGQINLYHKSVTDGSFVSLGSSQARIQAATNEGAFAIISSGHTNNLIYFTVQNNEPITVEDNNANGRTTLNMKTNNIIGITDLQFATYYNDFSDVPTVISNFVYRLYDPPSTNKLYYYDGSDHTALW